MVKPEFGDYNFRSYKENFATFASERVEESGQIMPSGKKYRPSRFTPKTIFIVLGVIVVIGALIYGAYIILPSFLGNAPYAGNKLLSGIMASVSKIESSSYAISVSLDISQRDKDAQPFYSKLANAEETKKKFKNDAQRGKDITAILAALNASHKKGPYPLSLDALTKTYASYYGSWSLQDPVTKKVYEYAVNNKGDNFSLSATFETNEAILTIKKSYGWVDSITIINGKTVTFTKDSNRYVYFSESPPKPLLVSLGDVMAFFPPESKVDMAVRAQSSWIGKNSADWKFNMGANGDFGDLAYKVDVDALKKGQDYFFRINNMPSLPFGLLPFDKKQWIKVKPETSALKDTSVPLSSNMSEFEQYYKENREEIISFLKNIITIADEEQFFSLKRPVYVERVGNEKLYRYDLEIRKDSLVPFYTRIQEEISKMNVKEEYDKILTDDTYFEYLKSDEFGEIFDYYRQNTAFTLWANAQGFPVIASYSMRIVPSDSVTMLKDKQANLIFKIELSDINKPIEITAPVDYKNIEDYSTLKK